MEGARALSQERTAKVIPIRADLDESAWVRRVQQGDREAFPLLIERHQKPVYAFCLRMLQDGALARDVAQEVFLTFWREREQYAHEGKLRSYLLTIARFRCLASLKKRRREVLEAVEPQSHAEDLFEGLAKRQAGARVMRALSKLEEPRASLIRMRYLDGLNIAEIAQITQLKPGTIKSRLSRGLAELRKALWDVR